MAVPPGTAGVAGVVVTPLSVHHLDINFNKFWVVSTLITCAALLLVSELVIRIPPKIQSPSFNITRHACGSYTYSAARYYVGISIIPT